jgi:hypothetical protein
MFRSLHVMVSPVYYLFYVFHDLLHFLLDHVTVDAMYHWWIILMGTIKVILIQEKFYNVYASVESFVVPFYERKGNYSIKNPTSRIW